MQYNLALGALMTAARRGIAESARFDAVLTPTVAQLPRPVGYFTAGGDPGEDFERQKRFTPWTAIYNTTGPAGDLVAAVQRARSRPPDRTHPSCRSA